MGKAKPLGVLLGLTGNVLIAVALYQLIQTGECGGDGAPPCPSDAVPYFVMLPVGIVLSIAAAFAGGAVFGFAGTFLAVGIGSIAAAAFGDNDEVRTFGWVFGGGFAFFGLLPLLGGLALWPWAKARVAKAQRLVSHGAKGVGTVIEVRDTGITINDNPRVKLRMRIDPDGGAAPFEAEKAVTVSRLAIPREGDRFPVWYDPADPETWAYGAALDDAPTPPPAAADGPLDELSKLNDLRMKGALTDEEFQVAKDRLLAQLGGGTAPTAP